MVVCVSVCIAHCVNHILLGYKTIELLVQVELYKQSYKNVWRIYCGDTNQKMS